MFKEPQIPECNGQAQLWFCTDSADKEFQSWDRLRIIYPSGKVEYFHVAAFRGEETEWVKARHDCTTGKNQLHAVKRVIKLCRQCGWELEFVGYV